MTRGVGGHSPANVQKFLAGMHYPASKNDLLECAKNNDAPSEVLDELNNLQTDQFGGPQDVMKAYGKGSRPKLAH